jgi:GNAT superfamily N-acetyltransferase
MPPTPTLTIRAATPADTPAAVRLLAAAYADSEIASWIVPDPAARRQYSLGLLQPAVDQALHHGVVQLATDRGEIIGAALWLACPSPAAHQPTPSIPASPGEICTAGDLRAAAHRRRQLEWILLLRHPARPHHHLTHLAVRPDRRGHGVGSQLLLYHHAYLHATGTPAYLEAPNSGSHDLFLRHGYTTVGPPVLLPGTGIPIRPMWRPPGPAHHQRSQQPDPPPWR